MFVPIHDDNPLQSIKFQYVTLILIAINVAVFVFQASGVDHALVASFGVVPGELFHAGFGGAGGASEVVLPQALPVPEWSTLVTHTFFHGGLLHLVGNMAFLWVFGDNVEDAIGHLKFLVFYLACGVIAGLTHAAVANGYFGSMPLEIAVIGQEKGIPVNSLPLIGASGAVAGVIAAYLMLHPRVRVWVLAFRFIPLRISALLALGAWVVMQIVMVMLPMDGPVAWWAHIGGLAAGAVLILVMRRPGVPLFDRQLART